MASRVQDAAFLTAAVIALIAFGLLIVLTRPAASTTTAGSPAPSAIASVSAIPSIVITTAVPATSTPATTTAAPAATAPPPTATPVPRVATAPPTPSPTR